MGRSASLSCFGQDRAVEAVQFAVAVPRKGYNVYARGASAGKHTVVWDLLKVPDPYRVRVDGLSEDAPALIYTIPSHSSSSRLTRRA
jgi:AAA domain